MNRLFQTASRTTVAGFLILSMLILTMIDGVLPLGFFNSMLLLAGLSGWFAAVLLIIDVSRAQQIQVFGILGLGVGLLVYAASHDVEIELDTIISGNVGLLTMVTTVGFLRLVAVSPSEKETQLPAGPRAYLGTLFSTGLFGSVINISAPILIADRINDYRPLQRFTSQSITRVFSTCASWSPFFAGMAVVITYVENAAILPIMLAGLPFAIVGFIVIYAEARCRYSQEMKSFVGYPLKLTSLWIPAVLAISVVLGNQFFPHLSILVVISISALLITVCTLFFRLGFRSGGRVLHDHVRTGLPRTVNELTLFLVAGVLASGISAMLQVNTIVMPVSEFNGSVAIVVLGGMILIAAMGVHPVILISGFTPLLLVLNPNPNLLAVTYLFAWSLGTSASPLSGTHLVFQGRYGIPSWKAAMWNWPYVIMMYFIGAAWLSVVSRYFF